MQELKNMTNLEVDSFGFENSIVADINLWFFEVELRLNFLSLQLFVIEIMFWLDIIISFFVIREEDALKYEKPITELDITARSYYDDGFWFNFIVWFPWDYILSAINENFGVLSLIKCMRLIQINDYMNDT